MNCPECGTELYKTNLGNYYCPNCGLWKKEEEKGKENPEYIG